MSAIDDLRERTCVVGPTRFYGELGLKPWQHIVEWPDRQVVLGAEFLLATAQRRPDGLYQIPGYIIHRYEPTLRGYLAVKLYTGGSIIVSEDHDPGDEA